MSKEELLKGRIWILEQANTILNEKLDREKQKHKKATQHVKYLLEERHKMIVDTARNTMANYLIDLCDEVKRRNPNLSDFGFYIEEKGYMQTYNFGERKPINKQLAFIIYFTKTACTNKDNWFYSHWVLIDENKYDFGEFSERFHVKDEMVIRKEFSKRRTNYKTLL